MDNEKSQDYKSAPPPNYQQTHQGTSASAPLPQSVLGAIYVPAPPGEHWPPTAPTVVYVNSTFGPHPQRIICPICTADVITTPQHTSGLFAYLMSGFLCLIGCWPCCLIPCFVDSCMDVEHTCPSCNHKIGLNKRL